MPFNTGDPTHKVSFIYFRVDAATGELRPWRKLKDSRSDCYQDIYKPLPRGGLVFCIIKDSNGVVIGTGFSQCSRKDVFVKKVGRKIAFDRAKAELNGKQHNFVMGKSSLLKPLLQEWDSLLQSAVDVLGIS